VLFGHSHLGSIARAYDLLKEAGDVLFTLEVIQFIRKDVPHIVHGDEGWQYNPDHAPELRAVLEASRPHAVFCSLQGEQAIWAGLIAPEQPFGFFIPDEANDASVESGEVVPFDLIMEVCKERHYLARDFLAHVKPFLTIPAFGLSPPPPVGDAEFLMERLRNFDVYPRLRERGIPAKIWRRKIWRTHVLALADIYAAQGVRFLCAPAESIGEDGCLRPGLYSDAFHASPAYGMLVLKQMQDCVAELPKQEG
jgi:hypothetical protein